MSYQLLAIYFATSHFRQKKTTPCSLRMRKTPLTKGLSVDCARLEVRTLACERMVAHLVSRSNLPIIRCILSSMCSAPMITANLSYPNMSGNCHWISLMIAYSG